MADREYISKTYVLTPNSGQGFARSWEVPNGAGLFGRDAISRYLDTPGDQWKRAGTYCVVWVFGWLPGDFSIQTKEFNVSYPDVYIEET